MRWVLVVVVLSSPKFVPLGHVFAFIIYSGQVGTWQQRLGRSTREIVAEGHKVTLPRLPA